MKMSCFAYVVDVIVEGQRVVCPSLTSKHPNTTFSLFLVTVVPGSVGIPHAYSVGPSSPSTP